jgi:hypothetical protein
MIRTNRLPATPPASALGWPGARNSTFASPKRASWINLVERSVTALTEKQTRRGVHHSVSELEAPIKSYLAVTNRSPKPFTWKKRADEILAEAPRSYKRTSEKEH